MSQPSEALMKRIEVLVFCENFTRLYNDDFFRESTRDNRHDASRILHPIVRNIHAEVSWAAEIKDSRAEFCDFARLNRFTPSRLEDECEWSHFDHPSCTSVCSFLEELLDVVKRLPDFKQLGASLHHECSDRKVNIFQLSFTRNVS